MVCIEVWLCPQSTRAGCRQLGADTLCEVLDRAPLLLAATRPVLSAPPALPNMPTSLAARTVHLPHVPQSVMPDAMTSMPAVVTKMVLDQLVMSPLSTALFFMVMRAWEGHPQDAFRYMRGKMVPTLKANYLLWPLAHIINFALVPPSQRILYCNAVGLIWTVILSTILNSRAAPDVTTPPAAAGSSGPGTAAPTGGSPDSVGGGQPMGPEDLTTAPVGFVGVPTSGARPPAYARYTKPRDTDSRHDA